MIGILTGNKVDPLIKAIKTLFYCHVAICTFEPHFLFTLLFIMAAQGWPHTIAKGVLLLTAVLFSVILVTYVAVMAYFSSKILKGWRSNRDAVFEEMKQEQEQSKRNKTLVVGAGADKEQDNEEEEEKKEDEPYMIAGFFHPYW